MQANGSKNGRMSKSTLTMALHGLGFDGTVHGCRSLLTDWCYEQGYRSEAIEAQLAHSWGRISRQREEGNGRGDQVRMAYLRSTFWEHRQAMLQHWADTVTALEKDKVPKPRARNVVSLRAA